MDQKGFTPNPTADKATLLRRVYLDLIGLPPSVKEMDAFLNDSDPDAFEKVVDQLLASPHYGEQMAVHWMDLARYADTHGYTVDRYRDMSPWRDWVIRAFNDNMPYDQFVTWQLAGDLFSQPSQEQILATAFNRNHQQNMEGGIIDEEFRVEYVADRTNTLGAVFLGLTLECARCHDHKYDPISQKDYYHLFGFFNNVKEAGQISWDNAPPVPTLLLSNEKIDSIQLVIDRNINTRLKEVQALKKQQESPFENWLIHKRQQIILPNFPSGLEAWFDLSAKQLANQVSPFQKAKLKQQGTKNDIPMVWQADQNKHALIMAGAAWLDLGSVGVFDRAMPFSVSIWVNVPKELKDGVIFHKGDGAALYNYRGFHLAIKNNRLELLMAHTTPYNAIVEYGPDIPRDQWVHLTMTYDGSSQANGLKAFLNGQEVVTQIDQDKLYKSILFGREKEPGIQIGARWRGIGIKGALVREVMVFNRTLTTLEIQHLFNPEKAQSYFTKAYPKLSDEDKSLLWSWYLSQVTPILSEKKTQLQVLRKQNNLINDTLPELMVMQEMPKPRPTFVLKRGQYDQYGEQVFPNTPSKVFPMPEELPKNRLGLAQWLVHPQHPLTARVTVNRIWQQIFGQGIVDTPDDFGFQGALPTHPALLDWLATHFQESGWNLKALIKTIVLSATYQQSSEADSIDLDHDKYNIWLSRGPSSRLTAEMIRDNALTASGLLHDKIGGKSVKPYQPEDLWKVNGGVYRQDSGTNLYRRGLYTFWKRSVPHPSQLTFDAPTRSNCTVKRQKTSTPLQALVLLNDPIYLEASKALALQIEALPDLSKGVELVFRKLTGRNPSHQELALLLELHQNEIQKFSKNPGKATGWISVGNNKNLPVKDIPSLAAKTVVASTILNADATIIKR